jgi:hypothetical protein
MSRAIISIDVDEVSGNCTVNVYGNDTALLIANDLITQDNDFIYCQNEIVPRETITIN